MRNYALITTAISALLLGLSFAGNAAAQDALADTLPAPASATAAAPATTPAPSAPATAPATASATLPTGSSSTTPPVFTPAAGASTTSTTTTSTTGTAPTTSGSAAIVPVTSSSSTLSVTGAAAAAAGGGLNMSPSMPTAVQDAMTRLQKVDQINLDDMVRAQDAINRLDLLLEIEKRQTELKKVRDERNKPAASAATAAAAAAGLLGSAIPASALNLPKVPVADTPSAPVSSTPSFTPKVSSTPKSTGGPSEKLSIKRISGTDGRYFAVINMDDNTSQTVHAGDKLPDGTLVKSITLTSVSLFKDKKSKNLTIPTDSYIVRESATSTQ